MLIRESQMSLTQQSSQRPFDPTLDDVHESGDVPNIHLGDRRERYSITCLLEELPKVLINS